jgi:outer membrane protein insertion porin family
LKGGSSVSDVRATSGTSLNQINAGTGAICGAGAARGARALLMSTLLGSTMLVAVPVLAQVPQLGDPSLGQSPANSTLQAGPAAAPDASAASNASGIVSGIVIKGTQRLEPETVRSYLNLAIGDSFDRTRLDQALKALYASELFSDVTIQNNNGTIVINVVENPVVNRVVIEGAKRVKEDKVREEIRLAPRQIFTRSKVSADVARILELYQRSGRFAASVEPKMIKLDQNRVDIIYEINEGPKAKVQQINILGNHHFSDGDLRQAMATQQARWYRVFASNDTFDPDRMAYDQQKLRQFYLTHGYADFRVVSAIAELTPDGKDFIISYVVDEGKRYKFGDVELESQIRDIKSEDFKSLIRIQPGDWYDAQRVENVVTLLSETAGLLGYAFADVRPQFNRDKDKLVMNLTFVINEAPRVYVERININGNTRTRDRVIRREFRLAEGDAFNSIKVKRSRDRLQGLGYFQDKLEIEQKPGSGPDKVILEANVQEKPTGQLQVSAGYSSLEGLILSLSITERNFRGKGQELRASANVSSYSKSIEAGFTEPYLFGRNLALGFDVFRRDYNSFNYTNTDQRTTTYNQNTTGFQIRTGFSLNEFWAASVRYGLSYDSVTIDPSIYYGPVTNPDGTVTIQCSPTLAGRYLCDAVGNFTTSSIGYSLLYDSTNNRGHPSAGQRFSFNQDLAGVLGGVDYLRTRVKYDYWHAIRGSGFVFNFGIEGGYILPYGGQDVRLVDRFFLGSPTLRGFAIRGVGPRIIRKPVLADGTVVQDESTWINDSIGGQAYYNGRLEVQVPLGSSGAELGLRPSIFADFGGLWDAPQVLLIPQPPLGTAGYREFRYGDSPTPRVSVGAGVSWNSPFGPFRFDLAKAIVKQEGDITQVFQFNVGTQF